MDPMSIAGDIIGAVAFWLFGISYREQLSAAYGTIEAYVRYGLKKFERWCRHDLAVFLKPFIWAFGGLQIAAVVLTGVWIAIDLSSDPHSVSNAWWMVFLAIAAFFALVPAGYSLAKLWNTKRLGDGEQERELVGRIEQLSDLFESLKSSLKLGKLDETVVQFLSEERDRVYDAVEVLEHKRQRTPEEEAELAKLHRRYFRIERLYNLREAESLDMDARRLVRQYMAVVERRLQTAENAFEAHKASYGTPADNVGGIYLLFVSAPFLTGMSLLVAVLCARDYNNLTWTSLLVVDFVAIGVYLLGEKALKITLEVMGQLLEKFDTVFDETADAVLKPLLAAGLVGTTFKNVGEKFKPIDLPIKEIGTFTRTLPSSLILAMRSVVLWTLIFPFPYTVPVVFFSAIAVSQLAYKLTAADLKDDAKAFIKKVAKTEHKILYTGYVFWLVAMFWSMLARDAMPILAIGNGVIRWINSIINMSGMTMVGSVALGGAFVYIAGWFKKPDTFVHRIYQTLNIVGAALIVLPLVGLAAWMGGADLALPELHDAESAGVAHAAAPERSAPEHSALDIAEHAGEHPAAPTTPVSTPLGAALGGGRATAVTPTAPAASPSATEASPTRPADASRAHPRDTHRLEHLDPEFRAIAEDMGFDT